MFDINKFYLDSTILIKMKFDPFYIFLGNE